jgi:hypothetical protein
VKAYQNTLQTAKSTSIVGPEDPIVCRRETPWRLANDSQHPFGNQAAGELITGPWFCAPAFRLVCLFEDDDAAGPFRETNSPPDVGQAFKPDDR